MSNVVYVETLGDFLHSEVRPDLPVRLILTQTQTQRGPLAQRQYTLTLAGTNTHDEIVVLQDRVSVEMDPMGKQPWTPGGKSIVSQVQTWRWLVHHYVEAHGYTVYPGMYAVPENHTSVVGSFNDAAVWSCAKRDKSVGDGWCEAWIVAAPISQVEVTPMTMRRLVQLAYSELADRIENEPGVPEELEQEMLQLEAFVLATGFESLDAALAVEREATDE
ncbi:MAG: hypothetical protein RBT75_18340 [Anaerolineae bacterium]|jgi:hypothetical protein|nr:hypothetical protein [Anaerolineae bacterium]